MEEKDKASEEPVAPSAPARPSAAPSPFSPSRPPPSGSERAGGPPRNYRILFALCWVVLQVTLVVTAERRADGAFGFRMFSESSTIKIELFREVDGPYGKRSRVHVDEGVWTARASDGKNHRLTWYDRVPMPYWVFDQEMHASYGAATQLARLQGALDDLATHISASDDLETRRFILDVTVRRNGREPVVHELVSRERALPSPPSSEPARGGGP